MPSAKRPPSLVHAAGAVVWRENKGHVEVLMIHRPKYDDWSFPKGKVDRGERLPVTAFREVEEESGVRIRLRSPLLELEYPLERNPTLVKHVTYWLATPRSGADVARYRPNREVDEVRWVRVAEADPLLTYDRDRDVLRAVRDRVAADTLDTRTLLVVRHAEARSRSRWKRPDALRPLTQAGDSQARRLVPMLLPYAPHHLVTSDATRCTQTLGPLRERLGRPLKEFAELSEEGATARGVQRVVEKFLAKKRPAVIVSHRPVLPLVLAAVGAPEQDLDPADVLVVHHRDGAVVAVERHPRVA